MRLIAFVTDSGSSTRILAYLSEPTKAPHIAPAVRGPPWDQDFAAKALTSANAQRRKARDRP